MNSRAKWADTIHDHLTKQIAVKGRGQVDMGGLRAEIRQIGESWLWSIVRSDKSVTDTSLVSGCDPTAELGSQNAAKAMAQLLAGNT